MRLFIATTVLLLLWLQGLKPERLRSKRSFDTEGNATLNTNKRQSKDPSHLDHSLERNRPQVSSGWVERLFPDTPFHSGPNISNCIWTYDENKTYVRLECRGVVINNTAKEIPNNVTVLSFYNCPQSTNLSFPSLSHLTELQRLDISRSEVRNIEASFLSGLVKLHELHLCENSITNLVPNLLSNVSSIRYLDLRGNAFSDLKNVTVAASVLTNLNTLVLDNNPGITEILASNFLPLQNSSLEFLSLAKCGIKKIELDSFKPLFYLKHLVLGSNEFNTEGLYNVTKSLTWAIIDHLQLRNLSSVFNGSRFITKELQPLSYTNIAILDLDYNNINRLERNAFPMMVTLRKLRLCHCGIQFIHPKAFPELDNLKELYLTHNKLKHLILEVPKLHVLDLSSNTYKGPGNQTLSLNFRECQNCRTLQKFLLRKSYFKGPLTKDTFGGLVNLEFLEVSYTFLSNISELSFAELGNLKDLVLTYNNKLTELGPDVFVGLRNLTQLHLSYNRIETIDANVFKPLASLTYLSFHNNYLKVLPENVFSFNTKLVTISLTNNKLKSWNYQIFPNPNTLQEVMIRNNKLVDVTPVMLEIFKKLKLMDLSDNPFECNTCSMKQFQLWIQGAGNLTVKNLKTPDSYTCRGNGSLLVFNFPEEVCIVEGNKNGIGLSVSMTVICLVLVGFLISLCKLRWKITNLFRTRYRQMAASMNDDRAMLDVNGHKQ